VLALLPEASDIFLIWNSVASSESEYSASSTRISNISTGSNGGYHPCDEGCSAAQQPARLGKPGIDFCRKSLQRIAPRSPPRPRPIDRRNLLPPLPRFYQIDDSSALNIARGDQTGSPLEAG